MRPTVGLKELQELKYRLCPTWNNLFPPYVVVQD